MSSLESHLTAQGLAFTEFFWNRLRWRAVSEYFPRWQRFTVLDVGAGAGHFGAFLANAYPLCEYSFVEPLAALESQLEIRFGSDRNARESKHYPGINYVTLLDVLEHQPDDAAFLEELLRATDPGTVFILTVPALMSLWSDWDVALGHYRRYDRGSMASLLARLPVDVLEVSYLFPELVPPAQWRALRSRSARRSFDASDANLPNLPRSVNRTLYRIGCPAIDWRRRVPIGSSLLAAVCNRRA